ncbi:hypothetical protein COEREDRAFT_6595 [Coemansia reversa NRRL 1564]|uniref:Carbohydrate-binding module family 19 domain-containing protein n=1 Tax=Coemansia reversa (strain ATCC 12441 / NRRL 1564) TaxID=763665 RepID=A0A2G5BH67_COERN|nr:hypothetical protein COEREDRAFT_6595 [Coemansia reversa NRRL 1564]|eukprot:PIA18359.1 hypothetical protein COEREDRAFT_6595 [Coemansia reversa NRRL 1564]
MRLSNTIAFTAVLAATASAQTCKAGEKRCDSNTSVLLECENGEWSSNSCDTNMYCMTMGGAMVHCMLKPDGGPTDSGSSDNSESSSTGSNTDSDTSSKENGTGHAPSLSARGALAAAATVAFAAIGFSAFF